MNLRGSLIDGLLCDAQRRRRGCDVSQTGWDGDVWCWLMYHLDRGRCRGCSTVEWSSVRLSAWHHPSIYLHSISIYLLWCRSRMRCPRYGLRCQLNGDTIFCDSVSISLELFPILRFVLFRCFHIQWHCFDCNWRSTNIISTALRSQRLNMFHTQRALLAIMIGCNTIRNIGGMKQTASTFGSKQHCPYAFCSTIQRQHTNAISLLQRNPLLKKYDPMSCFATATPNEAYDRTIHIPNTNNCVTHRSQAPTHLDQVEDAVHSSLSHFQTQIPSISLQQILSTPKNILQFPQQDRECIGVASNLKLRLDSFGRSGIHCRRCWLQRRHCVCWYCLPLEGSVDSDGKVDEAFGIPNVNRLFLLVSAFVRAFFALVHPHLFKRYNHTPDTS